MTYIFLRSDGATLNLSAAPGLRLLDAAGFSNVGIARKTEKTAGQHGVTTVSYTLDGRELTFSLELADGQAAGGQAAGGQAAGGISPRRRLLSFFDPLHRFTLQIADETDPAAVYTIPVTLAAGPALTQRPLPYAPCTLSFFADDPFFTRPAPRVRSAAEVACLTYPFCYEDAVVLSTAGDTFTLRNDGAADAPLWVSFTGPAANPALSDARGAVLRLNRTLAAGTQAVVSTENGQHRAVLYEDGVASDITAAISDDSTLFSLPAGRSTLRYAADAVSAGSAEVIFYERYTNL